MKLFDECTNLGIGSTNRASCQNSSYLRCWIGNGSLADFDGPDPGTGSHPAFKCFAISKTQAPKHLGCSQKFH